LQFLVGGLELLVRGLRLLDGGLQGFPDIGQVAFQFLDASLFGGGGGAFAATGGLVGMPAGVSCAAMSWKLTSSRFSPAPDGNRRMLILTWENPPLVFTATSRFSIGALSAEA
jgi:hypothetical protein